MSTIRFGLIGLGIHGERYARHLMRDIRGAELYAVCRQDPAKGEAYARQYNVRYYREYIDLISDPNVDAMVVVTPTVLNERICTTAAAAGKPVLVEKPLARNSREAINIVETVARSGSLFMVGHTLRFNSVVRALEHHLDELGPLHTITMNQRLEPSERLWTDDFADAGGGVVLQTGIHMFDLLRYFSDDEVRRVYCETDRIVYEELEDSFVATMRLRQSKARCLIDAARYTESRSGRIELVGEQGQLVGDHVHGYGMLIRGRELTPLDIPPAVNTIEELLKAFLSAILNDEDPPITVIDGLHSLEIAEACYHASSSGSAIDLLDEDEDEERYDDDFDDDYWDV
ncbi:hypothetical protein C2W62_11835 [Candidatus Entotheonella serta]|nr:hypothetical protein C2W62_11835 [Candidatus Entotheonella serta]